MRTFLAVFLLLGICVGRMQGSAGPSPSAFPAPLSFYQSQEAALELLSGSPLTLWQTLVHRAMEQPMNVLVSALFLGAIVHTFLAPRIGRLARQLEERGAAPFPSTLCHYLGEVEAIFGIWVIPVALTMGIRFGWHSFTGYLQKVSYNEPMFVIVIMAMAATRPVIACAERLLGFLAGLGRGTPGAWWISILLIAPLLGSFITEPAAITIAALLLARKFYDHRPSPRLAYATIGLLFVNVSVGGALSHFAAPPILMVASLWHWDMAWVFRHFGLPVLAGITLSTLSYALLFRRELARLATVPTARPPSHDQRGAPFWVTASHLLFIGWTVFNLHTPQVFWFSFLIFLAFMRATAPYQSPLRFREPLLVGFFLAGLVTHGGLQEWWIAPLVEDLSARTLFLGSALLSTFNDNAAVTYLTTLVPKFWDNQALQYAVVSGALTGGGLTLIANAPNPAGQSLLQRYFQGGIAPLKLAAAAALPTAIVGCCFLLL
ncbi:MAG: putative Na+/H+ antiporter [Puniceicoccales bacterium]|jgi:Na+/H+ antiporter NhaD/arsenite permease-like protein|nr:putative Na+/H+ antiporter [Puniceicoccales bacterium]